MRAARRSPNRIACALPPSGQPTARQWQHTAEDRALLGHFNRLCSRCHSSVTYHVFDKEAAFERRDGMARRVERGTLKAPGRMPQGRMLEPSVSADRSRSDVPAENLFEHRRQRVRGRQARRMRVPGAELLHTPRPGG